MGPDNLASRRFFSRRQILALGALTVLENACSSASSPTATPTEKLTIAPIARSTPTVTSMPTAISTRVAESKAGKAWRIQVNPNQLGNLDPHDPEPPAFLWNGKRLFLNGLNGSVMEVDVKNGRDIEWEWKGKGFCLGVNQGLLYLAHFNGLRFDAFNADSKFQQWYYQLRKEYLNPAAAMAAYTAKDIRWPAVYGDFFTGFQFDRGFFAINPDKKLNVESKGFIVQLSQARILFTSELYIWGSRDWGLFNPSNKKYIWTHQPSYKRPTYGAADSDVFVVSLTTKVQSGLPYLDGPFVAQARSMVTGDPIWDKPKEIGFDTGTAKVGKDLVMVGGTGRDQNNYWLFSKSSGDEVARFTSQKLQDPFKFVSNKEWFFASSNREGGFAYLNGKERWKNPQLSSVDSLVKATTDQIILTHDTGKGIIWALDPQNGHQLWPAVNFDQPITSKTLVGDKLVVAIGEGKVGSFSIVNIKDGKKTDLDLNLVAPMFHLTGVGTSAVLGQSGNHLLAIKIE